MSRDVLAQHCYYCCSNKVMFLRFMGPCIVRIFQYISNQMQLFFLWRCDPTRVMASSFLRFLDHTQRRTTVGRTLLNEWSARRRDLYLTTHNTHNRQTSMPCVGFEPTISTDERPQTYALDRAATGVGYIYMYICMCVYIYIYMHWYLRVRVLKSASLLRRRADLWTWQR